MLDALLARFWSLDRERAFSPAATRLYMYLLHRVAQDGEASVDATQADLRAILGMTDERLTDARKDLLVPRSKRLVTYTPGIGKRASTYLMRGGDFRGGVKAGRGVTSEGGEKQGEGVFQTPLKSTPSPPTNPNENQPFTEAENFGPSPDCFSDFGIEHNEFCYGFPHTSFLTETPDNPEVALHTLSIINTLTTGAHDAHTHDAHPHTHEATRTLDRYPSIWLDTPTGKPLVVYGPELGKYVRLNGYAHSELAPFVTAHDGKRYDDLDDLRILVRAWVLAQRVETKAQDRIDVENHRRQFTVEQRKAAFVNEVEQFATQYPDLYPAEFYPDFLNYWCEASKDKKRFRKEGEDSWETPRRLEYSYRTNYRPRAEREARQKQIQDRHEQFTNNAQSGPGQHNNNRSGYQRAERTTAYVDLAAALEKCEPFVPGQGLGPV